MSDATLETRVARAEQSITDLNQRVNALSPLTTQVGVLVERVDNLRTDVAEYAAAATQDRKDAEAHEANRRRERDATRKWAIGILVAVLLGLLSAGVALALAFA